MNTSKANASSILDKISKTDLLDLIVEQSDDAIISKDLNGNIMSWNKGAEKLFGYSEAEMVGRPMITVFPADRLHEEDEILEKIKSGKTVDHFDTIRTRKDGSLVRVSVTISPLRSRDGEIVGASKIARDITEKYEAERLNNQYRAIIESSDDAIVSKDLKGIVTSWNPGAERVFGYTADEMIGQPMVKLFPPDKIHEEAEILRRLAAGDSIDHFETKRLHKNGSLIDVSVTISPIKTSGEVVGASKVARDISERVKAQAEIHYRANHDSLTGLPNRGCFLSRLHDQIETAKNADTKFALMFVDLDNFKLINDTYGHVFGDEVIVYVGGLLKSLVDEKCMIARIGGDEFVILLDKIKDLDELLVISNSIIQEMSNHKVIDDRMVTISASIGIATYPLHGDTQELLLKKADHAMYMAKSKGKNQSHMSVYDEDDNSKQSYSLLCDLNSNDLESQLVLYFQPIVDFRTGKIQKTEALVRWQHPEFGLIPPGIFIPLAEKYGVINKIGEIVMAKALEQLSKWVKVYDSDFQMSVNKSPLQFHSVADCPAQLISDLKSHQLAGENLIIEITEDSMVNYCKVTQDKLLAYADNHISIALDDFGKGYSSLTYLKDFSVDFLKLDKAFISSLTPNSTEYFLTEGIAKIARNLGIGLVAEGVETAEQLEILRGIGVDYAQGFLLSRPVPCHEFEAIMASHEVRIGIEQLLAVKGRR